MTFKAIVQRIHLWAGLIFGVQVLLWMLSGVVMSWFPIELVRGETNAYSKPPAVLEAATYVSPGGVIAQVEGATTLELTHFLGRPAYLVSNADGAAGLFDASSGERLSPLSEQLARSVAKQDYLGEGDIIAARLMSFPPQEYRGVAPVWRIDFNDQLNTRIYVSQQSGEVKARRNDVWRLYDFFWMLHIMDYDERTNFNTWWLKLFAAAGSIFALSGMIIVIYRLRRGRYKNDLLLAGRVKPKQRVPDQSQPENKTR